MDVDSYVDIKNLSFLRGKRKIFDQVDLIIPKGKITAIMGPSGTGKTTLLNLITAQLQPHAGSIHVNGQNVHKISRKELLIARRDMGMLFQSGALFTGLDVYENVAYPLRVHTDFSESLIHDLVLTKLQAVGLRGAHRLMPNELSGGMARRVALARTIALDPALILYDEPFTGQDPISMGVLVKLIRSLNDALGATSIVVSHDVHETKSIADYIYILADSKVIGQGTVEELEQSDSEQVKQFLKGLPDGPVPFHYPAKDYAEDLLGEES